MHTVKDPCHSQHGRKGGPGAQPAKPLATNRPLTPSTGHFYTKILRLTPEIRRAPPDVGPLSLDRSTRRKEPTMSKRARKRRSRKGNAANHGRKPNA